MELPKGLINSLLVFLCEGRSKKLKSFVSIIQGANIRNYMGNIHLDFFLDQIDDSMEAGLLAKNDPKSCVCARSTPSRRFGLNPFEI